MLRRDGAVYVSEPLPEGDCYAMQSLIEIETETRAAALARSSAARRTDCGVSTPSATRTETRLESADAFRARMLAVDPAREAVLEERRDALEQAFATLGTPARRRRRQGVHPRAPGRCAAPALA